MAASLQIKNLIDAIADLVVAGWVICDLSNIPAQPDIRANAVAWPQLDTLIADLNITDESFGGIVAAKNATYTLNYVFAYKPVMAGRSITEYAAGMVGAAEDLLEAIVTTEFATAGLEVIPTGCTFGQVIAPDESKFWGGFIKLRVLTFVQ